MNCPICGKPRMYNNGAYTITTTMQSSTVSLNPEYCQGMCAGVTITNATISVNGVTLPIYDFHFETTPTKEKPLEWAEVERQLDDFMAELSKGEP